MILLREPLEHVGKSNKHYQVAIFWLVESIKVHTSTIALAAAACSESQNPPQPVHTLLAATLSPLAIYKFAAASEGQR
jgi:hypothetical protein